MSDNALFSKYRANELAAEFHLADKKKNATKRKQTLKKVIANITLGNHEMINLFPEIVKSFSSDDMESKRMCFHYFNAYALVKPDVTLNILPIILTDLKADDTALVALSLRNLVSIPIKEFLRESVKPIKTFLNDKDAFLRKTAVFAIARLYEKESQIVFDEGLIDSLKYMMGDANPAVVSSAITVLLDISEKNKKIKLQFTKAQALVLADLLTRSDEWKQVSIINAIMCFVPESYEDAFIIIDKVVAQLQHSNTAVVLNTFKLLLYLLNYVDVIEDYITRKLASSLTSLLSKPAELQFLTLRNVILLILSKPKLIPFDVTLFFCEYNDPIYIKDTKLEIIYLLASQKNLDIVLHELKEYATDIDVQMSRKAIRAIGNLAVKLEEAAKPCVETLVDLLDTGVEYIVQESIIVFKNIFRRYHQFDYVVPDLLVHSDKIEDSDPKASLMWIIGNFSDKIPNVESRLEELTSSFVEDPLEVQLASLTTVVKVFLRRPDTSQKLVLKILKQSTEDVSNPDVRSRGFFYWRLLSIQDKYPGTAKEVIDGDVPPISNDNDQLDPIILEELELNIGSLASIYLKPVGEVFRLARRRLLPDSPAKSTASSRVSTATSSEFHHQQPPSSASSSEFPTSDRHIDDYDVPAENVKPLKKSNGLSRRMTLSKSSLSRKLSIRGTFT